MLARSGRGVSSLSAPYRIDFKESSYWPQSAGEWRSTRTKVSGHCAWELCLAKPSATTLRLGVFRPASCGSFPFHKRQCTSPLPCPHWHFIVHSLLHSYPPCLLFPGKAKWREVGSGRHGQETEQRRSKGGSMHCMGPSYNPFLFHAMRANCVLD